MAGETFENIGRWVLLMLVQVLVFNNIYLGEIYNPYIYVLIVLSLPIELSALMILFIGFFTGFILDIFTHTLGLHTMAFTFLAFLRPFVLRLVAPRDGFEFGAKANLESFGWARYIIYSVVLILAHHLLLFIMEGFSTGMVWVITQKVVLNTLLTFSMVILLQSFSVPKSLKGNG